MQVNGIALVALESRVAGESLHDSRCFDKYKGRLGFEVAYHGARERPFRAGMQSYSSCATGRETAQEAGHALHV